MKQTMQPGQPGIPVATDGPAGPGATAFNVNSIGGRNSAYSTGDMRKRGDELAKDFVPTGTPTAEADGIVESRVAADEPTVTTALVLLARSVRAMQQQQQTQLPFRVTIETGPLAPGAQTGLLVMNRPRVLLCGIINNTATAVTVSLVDMDGSSTSQPVVLTIAANALVSFGENGLPFPQRLGLTALTGTAPFRLTFFGRTY